MTQTSAVVFESPTDVTVRPISMPDPGPGEVQLRTLVSVVSAGTEGWVWRNVFTWQPTVYPCVPGYQRVAVVERVGEGVKGWRAGDKAVCTWGRWTGPVGSMWGSHAALANTPEDELYRIPAGVSDTNAAGFVVAQVGYNAASRLVLEPGDWVLVYGDGLIGQCAAQAARARGANVILAGHRANRLARSGLEHTINTREPGFASHIQAPIVAVIDTIQGEEAQREYTDLLQRGTGQIVYSGFTAGTAFADMALLQQRELTAHFVSGWTRARLEATLALMASGQINLEPLITHRARGSDAARLYQAIAEKDPTLLGAAIDWV